MEHHVPALVITGPVGAGKSTVAAAISDILYDQDIPHAFVDMDYLRRVHPVPEGDPFAAGIGYRNLAAIWPNLREVNPRCLVLADVVESRSQVNNYQSALPGTLVTIVRLDVPMHLIVERLGVRETEARFDWYAHRAVELQAIMEHERVADMVIDVDRRAPEDVAMEILQRAGIFQVATDTTL